MSVPMAYLGVIIIWSTTPLAIKWSSEGAGFLFGVSARMVLGVALCFLIMLLLRIKLPWHREARYTYLAAGLGLYGAMLCVYWGAQFIPSGLVSVIFGLTPIITGAMAAIWLAEQGLTPVRLTGMLVGFAGLGLIFGTGTHIGNHAVYGVLAIIGSVFLHSASTVLVKRIGAHLPALATTTGGLLVAVPAYVLTWLIFDGNLPAAAPQRTIISIVYLGVVGSALGFVLYYYLLRVTEASRVGLIPLVTPVIALFIGQWLNHEIVSINTLAGTALILSGLVFFQWGHLLGMERVLTTRQRQGKRRPVSDD